MAEFQAACGTICIVDDEMLEAVRQHTWRVDKHGYIARKTTIKGQRGRTVFLHRVIARCDSALFQVDHIDGDRLNNAGSNLRIVTKHAFNKKKRPGCASVFKGVTWHKRQGKWQAQLGTKGKHFYLGVFDDEHEAGHAYNRAAIEQFGECATLNPVGQPARGGDR